MIFSVVRTNQTSLPPFRSPTLCSSSQPLRITYNVQFNIPKTTKSRKQYYRVLEIFQTTSRTIQRMHTSPRIIQLRTLYSSDLDQNPDPGHNRDRYRYLIAFSFVPKALQSKMLQPLHRYPSSLYRWFTLWYRSHRKVYLSPKKALHQKNFVKSRPQFFGVILLAITDSPSNWSR